MKYYNPHDFPCTGFPENEIVLNNKPISYWKSIMRPVDPIYRRRFFLWRFRYFCEFENIPHIRIGGNDGSKIFLYLLHLILPRISGIDGDGI